MTRSKTALKERLNYLIANDRDHAWGLTVNTIGFQTSTADSVYPPKGHPSSYWFNPLKGRILHEFQIIVVVSGEGVFESECVSRTQVKAGHVIMLFPGEWHTFQPVKSKGWQVYWLGFNGGQAENLVENEFFSREEALFEIGL
ncbi:MAG: AraC family ligand binding domain-containing protein, partial [Flavitalea sp.]